MKRHLQKIFICSQKMATITKWRNFLLIKMKLQSKLFDLMEQTGYGIPLVTKRYGKTVFEFLDFFLRVTIPFEFEIENNVTQNDTQGDTQNDTQGGTIDNWIEEQIRKNPKITTEELAKLSGKSVITIKRHITKLSHIKYVGSGYSGHWEIIK